MKWTMSTEYTNKGKHPQMRAVGVNKDGVEIRSTWWMVDDGSAEQELHHFIRLYEDAAKKQENKERQ